jgi:hypothetical protein
MSPPLETYNPGLALHMTVLVYSYFSLNLQASAVCETLYPSFEQSNIAAVLAQTILTVVKLQANANYYQ